jgi:hypothetical protein
MKPAEGVVSAPFLPSGDQGHKGGFATLPKQYSIARRIIDRIPRENKPYSGNLCGKTGRKLGHTQKLGARPGEAKPQVLEGYSFIENHFAEFLTLDSAHERQSMPCHALPLPPPLEARTDCSNAAKNIGRAY